MQSFIWKNNTIQTSNDSYRGLKKLTQKYSENVLLRFAAVPPTILGSITSVNVWKKANF
jgi:hypothetical protein